MLKDLILTLCLLITGAGIVWGAGFGFKTPRLRGSMKAKD